MRSTISAGLAPPSARSPQWRIKVSQIAAVEDQVGRGLPQIRQDCLKRAEVAVDVGYDGDAHHRSPSYLTSSNLPLARRSCEDAPTNTVNRPGSATQS